ncbi:hypothetical protein Ssi03_62570 [Sphaerisporangium siamense]|nr:hypothetical protein Ssi03_62570 [Sphaerisporangium siamense]
MPPRRAVEATPAQLVASGASGGYGTDPVDGDYGWRRAGTAGREVPYWTQERARQYSVAAYRTNPMARAVIDTYTAFCVGDKGVTFQANNPAVRGVVEEFWSDPRNNLAGIQEIFLRDQLIMGETLLELMRGQTSGVVRYSPVDTTGVTDVTLVAGNPLWPDEVVIGLADGTEKRLKVAAVDDGTGLRDGAAQWWTPFKTLITDRRSMPFMMPILDWLDSYDNVLSNLIDRTALGRYLVWDVTVSGGQTEVDEFIAARGGTHVPRSGSVEVHNESVTWEAKTANTGSYEDTNAARNVLTLVSAGAGLAKTWLAEPEDANRATSLTMAEPVRRRVQGVQRQWLGYQTELTRYAVDRAVAARRLPRTVQASDPRTGETYQIPAAMAVTVTGPEVAAADAELTANVLLNLSTGLEKLVASGVLTREAAGVAARKAWEDFVGVPYSADLGTPDANPGDIATAVDDAKSPKLGRLAVVGGAANDDA